MLQQLILACLLLWGLSFVYRAATAANIFTGHEVQTTRIVSTLLPPETQTPIDIDERAVLSFLRSRHTGLSRIDELNVARAVVGEARRYDLDPALVLAVIQVESGGYSLAVSQVGAVGLMQLLPTTAEELAGKLNLDWRGPDSLFDPVLNIQLGTAYIRQLADRYGDVTTALAAYNWGPSRIDRRIRTGIGIPSIYSERVMKAFDVALSRRQAPRARG